MNAVSPPPELSTNIHAALRAWYDLTGTSENLLEGLLLVQIERGKLKQGNPTNRRLATNQVLKTGIEMLAEQNSRAAEILHLRFIKEDIMQMVASKLGIEMYQAKRQQRAAIADLAQIIWQQETAVRTRRTQELLSPLRPTKYSQLFGIEEPINTLWSYLQPADNPWLIAITGIGGIGKTAIADQVTRKLIDSFAYEQVAWVKVEPVTSSGLPTTPETIWNQIGQQLTEQLASAGVKETLGQQIAELRHHLKQKPLLVIIDNLETEESVAYLANRLLDLANPSKFLVTSRARFPNTASVFSMYLNQLEETAVYQFICHLAKEKGIKDLLEAEQEALSSIYLVTGGNPLAIKVVVGLTQTMALPEILQDFEQVHVTEIEQMYRHIYWKAWHMLDEVAQTVLEIMPLGSQKGMLPEQLQAASGLSRDELLPAIQKLVSLSLIEVTGNIWQKRYAAHQLLISFINSHLLKLPAR